jgi:rhodanese-related sulfurtransferase
MKNVLLPALVAVLLGVAAQAFADSDLDSAPRMSLEEFKSLHGENALYVIDVRYPRDYETGHIPGALLMPLEFISSYLPELKEVTRPIVTYCH